MCSWSSQVRTGGNCPQAAGGCGNFGVGLAHVVGEGVDAVDRAASRVADKDRGEDGKTRWQRIADRANAKLRSWRK